MVKEGTIVVFDFETKNTVSNIEFLGYWLNRYGELNSFDDDDHIDITA